MADELLSTQPSLQPALRVGLVPSEEPLVVGKLIDALTASIALVAARPAAARVFGRYDELLDALPDLDLAWLPPMVSYRAIERGLMVPLALPVRAGRTSYAAAVFARPNGGPRRLEDVVAARAAWVHPQSTAGYLLPRIMLESRGIDPNHAFAIEDHLGSHDAVVRAVLEGRADVGATFAYVDEPNMIWRATKGADQPEVRHAGWGDAAVRVLALFGPIPVDMLAASPRVGADLQAELVRTLVDRPSSMLARVARSLLDAERFRRPVKQHREALRTYAQTLREAGA
jgi:ABC-type phosphate/phosphonate transport system substrate-binding protein